MRRLFFMAFVGIGGLVFSDDASFIRAYDAGQFDVAAGRIQDANMSNPEVVRRVGVMYYNGKGLKGDQAKGRELLEQAMLAGDAMAAINLAKIYFKIEKNSPKAAWCLMVAECSADTSIQTDVIRLRECLGDNYLKGVSSYITQLRGLLADEQAALRNKVTEYGQERSALTEQIASMQVALKKKTAEYERERAELAEKISSEQATVKRLRSEFAKEREVFLAERKKQDGVLAAVKASSEKELEAAQKDIAGYRKIIKTMEVGPRTKTANTEEISNEHIYERYNQLIEEYNVLVRRYNRLLEASDGSACK